MFFQNLEVKTFKVKLEPENSPWTIAPSPRQLSPMVISTWTISPQTITPWAIPT